MSVFLFVVVLLLILTQFIRAFSSKDKRQIWSPSVFLSIYLSYYIIVPYFRGGGTASEKGQIMLLAGTALFYLVFQAVFVFSKKKYTFPKLNSLFQENNELFLAVILFIVAFLGNGIFNGFDISILSGNSLEDIYFDESSAYGHSDQYIAYLISLFPVSCSLLFAAKKRITPLLLILMLVALSIYVIGGFRYRILIFFIVFATFFYLYPKVRGINYFVVIPVFLVVYFSMGVIEKTRMYGQGLDANALLELRESGNISESEENMFVYEFSAECMGRYKVEDFLLFEPLANAVCSPLPRSLFPWKPKGTYLREANIRIYGTISRGCAYLNITEAYLSFGWLGIIIYALVLGLLSRMVWTNYLANSGSIGAILLLGLFNGTLYQIIARGYMSQALTTFIYYVVIPFFLAAVYKFLTRSVKR